MTLKKLLYSYLDTKYNNIETAHFGKGHQQSCQKSDHRELIREEGCNNRLL